MAPLTERPLLSGFLNIPRAYAQWFPGTDETESIECVLDQKPNPEVLVFSPTYCRIPGGLTDWYRTINAQRGDYVRIEVLRPRRKYRLSLVKLGQEKSRFLEILESLGLHETVQEAAHDLFKDGHYKDAVRNGFAAMNNFVKNRCASDTDLDGLPLMEAAFSTNQPLLTINSGGSQSERDERAGMLGLARGSILAVRNPLTHDDDIELSDPYVALEYLSLASLVCKVSVAARRTRSSRSTSG